MLFIIFSSGCSLDLSKDESGKKLAGRVSNEIAQQSVDLGHEGVSRAGRIVAVDKGANAIVTHKQIPSDLLHGLCTETCPKQRKEG